MTAMRKAFECHFHSDAQVREYVSKAMAIVSELHVPDDLREAAFTQAFQRLAEKQVTFEQVGAAGVLLNQRPQG